jgi:hypothetical protein
LKNLEDQLEASRVDVGGVGFKSRSFTCQSVRAIFAELHVGRIDGRGHFLASERPAGIAWGCLQAFKRMKDFTKHKFSSDLKISHILNLHLQDHAVM